MKPLIKWPGGKRGEIAQFRSLIPAFDRYIEPFVGGGALFFELAPRQAVIADTAQDLIAFYQLIAEGDEELKRLLMLYEASFSALHRECEVNAQHLLDLYRLWTYGLDEGMDMRILAPHRALVEKIAMSPSVMSELIADRSAYLTIMQQTVGDKYNRTAAHNREGSFSEKDLLENLITGFMSGYYLYQRRRFNEFASGGKEVSLSLKTANFYFVREYCYGSMFRYNARGQFNVPYGGMSYNKKDFAGKIRALFTSDVRKLLSRSRIVCEDFQALLEGMELTEQDFMFLDPPYDTDFSSYEGHPFGAEDQKRLADFLKQTKAKFLLVIKNTDYIYSLYEGSFHIFSFENTYTYNVRSRNDRRAEHLLITNVSLQELPGIGVQSELDLGEYQ